MKLSDILKEDVVDFAAKRKEKEFMDKVGGMAQAKRDDLSGLVGDIEAAEGRDAAMAQEILVKYGRELRAMADFLKRPVMSGGFKSGYALNDALKEWRKNHKNAPEKLRRAISMASSDDNLFKKMKQHYSLWNAITNKYPIEALWNIPNVDDFEVLEDIDANLTAARRWFQGK